MTTLVELRAAHDTTAAYVIGFFFGVGTMILVDVLYYRLTKRTPRKG